MGWMGGRYKTSKPISATAGIRWAAVLKVPLVIVPSEFFIAPSLRGKNSYQLPISARSHSTSIGNLSLRLVRVFLKSPGFSAVTSI